MQVILNFPNTQEGKQELKSRMAEFQAHLIVEGIRSLHIDDTSKRGVLSDVLETLKKIKTTNSIGQ